MELVVVFGPPAVGKMTVGRAICDLTGFKLLHNHMTIEPLLEVFRFGSPPFRRLVAEFRARIVEEAIERNLMVSFSQTRGRSTWTPKPPRLPHTPSA
jgi:hypothetical protein